MLHFITEIFQLLNFLVTLLEDEESQHQIVFFWDTIEYLPTDQMLAEILTQGVPGPGMVKHV